MKRARLLPAALVVLASSAAFAHPVDEVVQGAYLTLAPGEVRLELDLTPGTKVMGAVVTALDTNKDGVVSHQEARAYGMKVLGRSTLKIDGKTVPWTLGTVEVPSLSTLRLGNVIKIYATAKRSDAAGTRTLSYQNRYQPAKSSWIANVFLQPASGWQYRVTKQARSNDGRTLAVTYGASRS
ncbi:hypothetical protein [Deinococcus yavapaiensis]|uniref:EF-hand domain-containing protein n=1 Tax=Deinococcus yavapaiensis KR-236 TaxID=694435 RepID=A0A318S7G5_9DEIO|nr:hypothetical protein [Deinococcus yavapaiensis]PYE53836.1 hypothetical protein DES52_10794 [Deinococcus yavapaiensis KR-236]